MNGIMGLWQRGSVWYYKRSIEPKLRPFFGGRAQVWISLKTRDRDTAKLKAMRVGFEIERQIQDARKRLGSVPSPNDIAREWQRQALADDLDIRSSAPATDDAFALDAELEALSSAIADHKEALSTNDTEIVSRLLDEVLTEQRLTVSPQERQSFALSLLKSRLEALEVARKRGQGHADATPDLTARELLDAWITERRVHPKTATEWRAFLRRWEAVNGAHLRVREIGKAQVRAFKQSLIAAPSKLSPSGTLSPKTIRKALGSLATVFKWGVGQGYLDHSPFQGISYVGKEQSTEDHRRMPYSPDEAKLIFSHPLFASPVLSPTPPPKRFASSVTTPTAARYWIPILAAFSGARLAELGGLRVRDIHEDEGIWVLEITPHELRGVKSESSRRQVPIHSEVLGRQFLTYVKSLLPEGMLWPELKAGSFGNLTHGFSLWWRRFTREACELQNKRTSFHSWRHGAIDAMRRAGVQDSVISAVVGHRAMGITARYGQGHSLETLAKAVEAIRLY